jgi:putative RNA 2'-phosphotransferase
MGSRELHVDASRFLALVLRHRPQEAGISLDEHGWADVGELVEGISAKREFSLQMLEEIVATDSKKRYSFNEDHTRIRANQGHSIQVDIGLEEADPPAVLYHGTADRYMDSIESEGLVPKGRLYVHLSSDFETAFRVGSRHGSPVVLRVDAEAMSEDGAKFFLSDNGVWLTKTVRPEYLRGFVSSCG